MSFDDDIEPSSRPRRRHVRRLSFQGTLSSSSATSKPFQTAPSFVPSSPLRSMPQRRPLAAKSTTASTPADAPDELSSPPMGGRGIVRPRRRHSLSAPHSPNMLGVMPAMKVRVMNDVVYEDYLLKRRENPGLIGSIDQGTTTTRFVAVTATKGRIAAFAQIEHAQIYIKRKLVGTNTTLWISFAVPRHAFKPLGRLF